ncbi:hypothetical protein CN167_23065 [Sinorhizobium medicae]|uniref:hypothetical protein n=1 Tax=Sinorhizobium medicae TaxID=110321 RepID=UPI000FD98B08|nr:hypothetical protein [Sinorhizobium medicae]RVJ71433.1 hypothetical protein CN167_23065 [Sinorhizobium medicae]
MTPENDKDAFSEERKSCRDGGKIKDACTLAILSQCPAGKGLHIAGTIILKAGFRSAGNGATISDGERYEQPTLPLLIETAR